MQLCVGLEAGIEGAMHMVRARVEDPETRMEFGEWEVDDRIFEMECRGEEQLSLPAKRYLDKLERKTERSEIGEEDGKEEMATELGASVAEKLAEALEGVSEEELEEILLLIDDQADPGAPRPGGGRAGGGHPAADGLHREGRRAEPPLPDGGGGSPSPGVEGGLRGPGELAVTHTLSMHTLSTMHSALCTLSTRHTLSTHTAHTQYTLSTH